MDKATERKLKTFAQRNYERSVENCNSEQLVILEANDMAITDPWASECGRFDVDPIEEYGYDKFKDWAERAIEAIAKGL